MDFEFSEDQKQAVQDMMDFYHGPHSFFVVKGSAGTGKTSCVQNFVNWVGASKVVLTAPTNKAVKVLREKAAEHGKGSVACRTIYSLLGLKLTSNSRVQRVEPLGKSEVNDYEVVVIDESSMIGEELFGLIGEAADEVGVKFIFMGDTYQLPPVNEEPSRIFSANDKAVLTKVERHDNQILALANHLKDCIDTLSDPEFKTDKDEDGGVFCVNAKAFNRHVIAGFTSERYEDRPDLFKALAWTNSVVNGYNEMVRDLLYPGNEDMFAVGERVTAAKPVFDVYDLDQMVVTTDEEGVLTHLEVVNHPRWVDYKCYKLTIETEFSGIATAYVVHPDSRRAWKKQADKFVQDAKSGNGRWSAWHHFTKNSFHDIRPCYALTTHKSQGSTYETVFVDAVNILRNRNKKEALQCLYVACTRASKNLVVRVR